MKVETIYYSKDFVKQLRKLPKAIQEKAIAKEKIFKVNPMHNSLRLHQLKGDLIDLWSISIDMKYRIIFNRQLNGDLLFISIGKHDIVY
ncbi:type II toxin-antitoxin system mRNA interferase toxin, RelE/StbE family [Patescibacteria group bacterium]|nr:type II toxin-antitoxin system mRNA interferase toxin, RelE/StbE family [Patescibacteria group bacterium]